MKTVLIVVFAVLMNACSAGQSNPGQTPPSVDADPKTLKNSIAATPQSLTFGKALYGRHCEICHGAAGNGESEMSANLVANGEPKPSDLTDDHWDHGSTDGEIFALIRDGLDSGAMRGLNGKPGIGPDEMWHLVNYVRSIGPKAK